MYTATFAVTRIVNRWLDSRRHGSTFRSTSGSWIPIRHGRGIHELNRPRPLPPGRTDRHTRPAT